MSRGSKPPAVAPVVPSRPPRRAIVAPALLPALAAGPLAHGLPAPALALIAGVLLAAVGGALLLRRRRHRAPGALSAQAFRLLADNVGDIIFRYRTGPRRGFEYVNPATTAILGYTPDEHYADPDLGIKITHPDDRPALLAAMRAPDRNHTLRLRWTRKDGRPIRVEVVAASVRDPATGRVVAVEGIVRDVTDRLAVAERALADGARAAERAQRLFESNVVGMAINDLAGQVYEANDYYLTLHGQTRAELIAGVARWDTVTAPEYRDVDRRAADELRTTGFSTPFEKEYLRADGSRVPVLVYIVALPGPGQRVLALVMDMSARRQAEEAARRHQAELAHLSRVASVGEMASSLAHEINQPLAAIANYLGAATATLDAPATGAPPDLAYLRDAITSAAEQAHRAADIVRRMRRFVRRGEPAAHGPLDLAAAITDALRLADPELRRARVRVDLHLPADLTPVAGDAVEIQQVLINLLQNAVDAMADTPDDRRTITVRAATSDTDPDTVRASVADAGPGIPPDVAAHLFEPFLTTRPHGLGLGLAISRTIIENHAGRLTGENRTDGVAGAVFSFTLRRA